MNNLLDLHLHSNISNDGQYAPAQLMEMCKAHGLKAVALTDHNSVRGIAEAREAAYKAGIEFISGIELDCQFEGVNLHLLGYGIDPGYAEFEINEKDVLKQEQNSSLKRIQLVSEMGIYFEAEKVMELASDGVITGEMLAEAALEDERNINNYLLQPYRENGNRGDNPYVNFYWDFCSQGRPAYVPIHFIELSNAVKMIKAAGGIAILAHPGINIGSSEKLLEGIISTGIGGIEVYSSYHGGTMVDFYNQQAGKFQLLKTMGSDFHGKTKPAIKLGSMRSSEEAAIYTEFIKRLSKADCPAVT